MPTVLCYTIILLYKFQTAIHKPAKHTALFKKTGPLCCVIHAFYNIKEPAHSSNPKNTQHFPKKQADRAVLYTHFIISKSLPTAVTRKNTQHFSKKQTDRTVLYTHFIISKSLPTAVTQKNTQHFPKKQADRAVLYTHFVMFFLRRSKPTL